MSLPTAKEKQRLVTKRALETLSKDLGEDQSTLEKLYQAARDENELLEFKNYELQFKIQELERNLQSAISSRCTSVDVDFKPDDGRQIDARIGRLAASRRRSKRSGGALLKCLILSLESATVIDDDDGQDEHEGEGRCEMQSGTPTTNPPTGETTTLFSSMRQNRPPAALEMTRSNNATTTATVPTTSADLHSGIMDDKLNGQSVASATTSNAASAAAAAAAFAASAASDSNEPNDLENGRRASATGAGAARELLEVASSCCIVTSSMAPSIGANNNNNNKLIQVTANSEGAEGDETERALSLARPDEGSSSAQLELELPQDDIYDDRRLLAAAASEASVRDCDANEPSSASASSLATGMKCPVESDGHKVAEHENANEREFSGQHETTARKTNMSAERRPTEAAGIDLGMDYNDQRDKLHHHLTESDQRQQQQPVECGSVTKTKQDTEARSLVAKTPQSGLVARNPPTKPLVAQAGGKARIAMPVQPTRVQTSAGITPKRLIRPNAGPQQQQQQQQSSKPRSCSSQRNRSGQVQSNPMRVRSKSSLDQDSLSRLQQTSSSNLPLRMMGSSSQLSHQNQLAGCQATRWHANQTLTNSKRSSSSCLLPSPLDSDQISAAAGRRLARNQKSTPAAGHKQQVAAANSNNDKFVTQIPTLIDQSHASTKALVSAKPTARSIAKRAGATQSCSSQQLQTLSVGDSAAEPLTSFGLECERAPATLSMASETKSTESGGEVKSNASDCAPSDAEMNRQQFGRELSMSCVQLTAVNSTPPNNHSADSSAPPVESQKRCELEDSLGQRSDLANAKSVDQLALVGLKQESHCDQCKLLRLKLETLISERNQLRDQLNELDEMENDSRLMSQKLAKQLAGLEKQFDECKLDLEKSCENESKLRFHNKRLNFELRQRQDRVHNLTSQLNELRSKAKMLIRLQEPIELKPPVKVSSIAIQTESEQETSGEISLNPSPPMVPNAVDSCSSSQITSFDSVYSKSSFSGSSDGCSTSGHGDSGGSCNNSDVDCEEQVKTRNEFNGDEVDGRRESQSSGTSSSFDELSDQHEDEQRELLTKSTDDNVKDELCAPAGEINLLASSQQVRKKHISMARIVRGAQVAGGQTQSIAGQLQCLSEKQNESCQLEDKQQVQGDSSALDETSGQKASSAPTVNVDQHCEGAQIAPIQCPQAESGKAEEDPRNQQEPAGDGAGAGAGLPSPSASRATDSSSPLAVTSSKLNQSFRVVGAGQVAAVSSDDQQKPLQPVSKRKQANGKSPIELALEGVNELEQSAADNEALWSLCAGRQRLAQTNAPVVDSTKDNKSRARISDGQLHHGNLMGASGGVIDAGERTKAELAVVESCQPNGKFDAAAVGQLAAAAECPSAYSNSQLQQPKQSAETIGRDLIDGLKQEVSNLRLRLVQANTLNDNLILELKANQQRPSHNNANDEQMLANSKGRLQTPSLEVGARDRLSSFSVGCVVDRIEQSMPDGRCSWHPVACTNSIEQQHQQQQQQLKQQQQQQQQDRQQCLRTRRSSVVYVNGLNASVTHHHHHYDQQQQQHYERLQRVDLHQSNGQPTAATSSFKQFVEQPQFFRQQRQQTLQSLSLERELAEFLRFLQEKLHLHHGRTFELVSECQKLAMNTLLASYNQQISLQRHQRVVLAGNQAIRRAELQQQQLQPDSMDCKRAVSPPMATGVATLPPVRPPPRRRNRLISDQAPDNVHDQASGQAKQFHDEQRALSDCSLASSSSSSASAALQVAKQTLSSLVPIYYSCNKSQQRQSSGKNGNNNKENGLLEATNRGRESGSNGGNATPLDCEDRLRLMTNENELFLKSINQSNSRPVISQQTPPTQFGISSSSSFQPNRPIHTNDIYATVNKNALVKGVSVLRISDGPSLRNHMMNRVGEMAAPATTNINITDGRSQRLSGSNNQVKVFQTINQQQQQLASVKNSFSEEIERLRVHSNGQLLDLLTRQNFVESLITEKLKTIERQLANQER